VTPAATDVQIAWCNASELQAPSEPLPPRLMLATLILWGSKTQITLATSAFGMGSAGIQVASISAV